MAPQGSPNQPSQPLGDKWLKFVNFGLVPLGILGSLITLVMLADAGGDAGLFVIAALVDLAVGIALFFGLKNRRPWGWWLYMVMLVVKPLMMAVVRGVLLPAVIAFVVFCVPQLIYFNKRRAWFKV